MSETLMPFYPWLKAFHIIAVIAWMAGMLYLPRLFVYHCETTRRHAGIRALHSDGAQAHARHHQPLDDRRLGLGAAPGRRARRLERSLGSTPSSSLVIALSGMHGMLSRWRRDFEQGRNTKSQRFYRIVNEVPAVLMALIVILVVVKPF